MKTAFTMQSLKQDQSPIVGIWHCVSRIGIAGGTF